MDIKPLEHSDITALSELQPDGWPDIVPSFEFYYNSEFCFPITVTNENKIVGIGTTIIHNNVAWLAHIIVHPESRNKGIGQLITQTLVDSTKEQHCETAYLIATDLGAPVYTKLGFETETEYLVFKDITIGKSLTVHKNIESFSEKYRDQITAIDRAVSGEDRITHIEKYFSSAFLYCQDNTVEGYFLPELGDGLIIATTAPAGVELMKLRLQSNDHAIFPIDNVNAAAFLYQDNYKEIKTIKRMRLGKKRSVLFANIYNRIGGNLG